MGKTFAPDWGKVIDALVDSGMSYADIGRATDCQLTRRMVSHYTAGVQPVYWRGAILVDLWCKVTASPREQIPMAPVKAGYRTDRRADYRTQPQVQAVNLPQWPPVKRGPGRPKKQLQAA